MCVCTVQIHPKYIFYNPIHLRWRVVCSECNQQDYAAGAFARRMQGFEARTCAWSVTCATFSGEHINDNLYGTASPWKEAPRLGAKIPTPTRRLDDIDQNTCLCVRYQIPPFVEHIPQVCICVCARANATPSEPAFHGTHSCLCIKTKCTARSGI